MKQENSIYFYPCFAIHLVAKSREHFAQAMRLAFERDGVTGHRGKATHFYVGKFNQESWLVLYWHNPNEKYPQAAKQLPYDMDVEAAIDFCWHWLKTAERSEEPDTDGSNTEAFLVSTGEQWGHAGGSFYGIVEIRTAWITYGK